MWRKILIILMIISAAGCAIAEDTSSTRLHAFYYPWYGTSDFDGEYIHWSHSILDQKPEFIYPGGDEIGADFYPEGGCYSSCDPAIINRQMNQLYEAGIGVICVSWLGPDCFEARALEILMKMAVAHNVQISFHLEPAVQRSATMIREAIVYLVGKYGTHPAFYRDELIAPNGLFYVYDSGNTPAAEWARILTPTGDLTIRGTPWDTSVVGLILFEDDTGFIEEAGFDGGYAYFAVDGFSYGSTAANWPALVSWARERGLLFIPSVGPGYSDERIRPWNERNKRSRDEGAYYDCMFAKAVLAEPLIISITSFNEWHEGTQIEPAVPMESETFSYLDYTPLQPDAYLIRTKQWSRRWQEYLRGNDLAIKGAEKPWFSFTTESGKTGNCGGGQSRKQVDHAAVALPLTLSSTCSESYSGGGPGALLDGIIASKSYRDGCWQGYEGVDLQVEIDLGKSIPVSDLRLGFLCDRETWIFLPQTITVEGMATGRQFQLLTKAVCTVPESSADPHRYEEVIELNNIPLHQLRLTIEAQKICPVAHPGEGKPAWLFIDEIEVVAAPSGKTSESPR